MVQYITSVETTYGINSLISKLMTFVENVITNFFKRQAPLFSSLFDRPSYYLNDE
jgi:hypothetical protein